METIKNYTLCQKQKKCFKDCLCKYLVKYTHDEFNYLLYGKYKAKYKIYDANILYNFILKNKNSKDYSFSDCLSGYFKYYVDIDLKEKDLIQYEIKNINRSDFLNYILDALLQVLQEYTDCNDKLLEFIYCERSDKKGGFHIYFPYMITNISTAKKLIAQLYDKVMKENKYNYPTEFYKKVVDDSVYKINGLRMIYSAKDGAYYEINNNISTYKNIPSTAKEQLEILSLKTNEKTQNFLLKLKEEIKEEKNEEQTIYDYENINNNYDSNDIKQLVGMLKKDRCCSDRKSWIDVGLCLKNINKEYFDIWNTWSRQYHKYSEKECMEQWKSFKPKKDNGLGIGSLFYWASLDSPDKYREFKKKDNINNLIMECKNNFKDNTLQIKKIVSSENYYYIELNDTYCPIYKNEHDISNLYIEVTPFEVVMKCKSENCVGKRYPCNYIPIPNIKSINTLFNFNFNNMNIINFNTNTIVNDSVEIDENVIIFDNVSLNKLILTSLNGTHCDIAQVIYFLTKNKFNIDKYTRKWYEFKNHRWQQSYCLRNFISNELIEYYCKVIKYLETNKTKDSFKSIEKIKNLIKSLKTSSVKNNIMTELEEIYLINDTETFINKLDTVTHLLGFNNGIYDFKLMEFRVGKPEDYISMTCGYDFSEKPTKNYKEITNFLEDIQPEQEQRMYLLMCLASYLIGVNEMELFHILSSEVGRNGKSKLCELIGFTLGNYFSQVSSELFMREKPDPTKPHPELLNLIKKRIVIASEPDLSKGGKLNSAYIKAITGNDGIELRLLHENTMITFKANFGLILLCNDIPPFDKPDKALYKRLRCVNFPTEFVEEPKLPHHKKKNEKLSQNFKYWTQDFMLILIDSYKQYVKNGLKPTQNILKFTNDYKENADFYLNYLNENTEDSEEHVSAKDLYSNFKIWYKENYPNRSIPHNKEFLSGIKKHKEYSTSVRIGKTNTSGYKCIKIKDNFEPLDI